MASCSVSVVLAGAERSFQPGQELTGTVVVTTDQEVKTKGLLIRQLWHVHGRGNAHHEVVSEQRVAVDRLVPGSQVQYPFHFNAPDRPLTYHGHLINVDHCVRATVDVAWALDPKGEAQYRLVPGPGSAESYLRKAAGPEASRSPLALRLVGWLLMPVLVLLLLFLLVVLLPLLLIVWLVVFVRRKLAEGRLGAVADEVVAPPLADADTGYSGPGAGIIRRIGSLKPPVRVVRSGQALPLRLRFTPGRDVTLGFAEVKVRAVEQATSGSGKSSHTHTHTIWEQSLRGLEGRALRAGEAVDLTLTVALPETDALSLDAPSNKVTWSAAFRIDIPGWPDWVRSHELRMIPA